MNTHASFSLFGFSHVLTLAIIAVCAAGLIAGARRINTDDRQIRLRQGLALLVSANALMWWGWTIRRAGLFVPLHLCDVVIPLLVIVLLAHRQRLWELVYFWGIAGSAMALLTPNLTVRFPHPVYMGFFLTHGLTFISVLYLALVDRRPVYHGSVWRTWLITNGYAAVAGIINVFAGTNFLYLRAKPDQASLLDLLGPWPWYIVTAEFIFLFILYGLYLPHVWRRKRHK